ncbi:hypothetical protein [Sphaerotilus sp.]|uniref:hypothetical protein n=1 Tax=Sphaerotilus sp. TaxID=2093942 RepID=UPI002ACE182C|nr:hypothetical protein [Sphaerotilus sp.]MDZ7856880.1 hypothetical protein [Sphaerotilus sp.]
MPPPHHRHHPHGHPSGPRLPKPGVPASQLLSFLDAPRLDALLTPLVPQSADRAFVLRCLIGEGPIHHRGANYVLIALLARVLEASPHAAGTLSVSEDTGMPVPMRLPPHLSDAVEEGDYPLRLPTMALRALAGGDAARLDAMVDCLTDGPAQHVLANVVMVSLIEQVLRSRQV